MGVRRIATQCGGCGLQRHCSVQAQTPCRCAAWRPPTLPSPPAIAGERDCFLFARPVPQLTRTVPVLSGYCLVTCNISWRYDANVVGIVGGRLPCTPIQGNHMGLPLPGAGSFGSAAANVQNDIFRARAGFEFHRPVCHAGGDDEVGVAAPLVAVEVVVVF